MGYLFYRVVKGQLTVKKSQSRFENGSEREESLGISEEDIRDAKFTDINEEEN
jgi:hypothetical protein